MVKKISPLNQKVKVHRQSIRSKKLKICLRMDSQNLVQMSKMQKISLFHQTLNFTIKRKLTQTLSLWSKLSKAPMIIVHLLLGPSPQVATHTLKMPARFLVDFYKKLKIY